MEGGVHVLKMANTGKFPGGTMGDIPHSRRLPALSGGGQQDGKTTAGPGIMPGPSSPFAIMRGRAAWEGPAGVRQEGGVDFNMRESGGGSRLPRLVDKDSMSLPDRRRARVKHNAFSSRSLYSPEEEVHPVAIPFQPAVFNNDPLQRVRITGVGVSLPSLSNAYRSPRDLPSPRKRQSHRATTVIKKVSVPHRHGELWGNQGNNNSEATSPKNKGYVFHSERYQWDELYSKSPDSYSQRERLQVEMEYVDKLRGMKRKRELVAHREHSNLLLGGHKVELCERDDINSEINRLKSIVLPTRAKDLYVGRGFTLPKSHALNKPRDVIKPAPEFVPVNTGNSERPPAVPQSAPAHIKRQPTTCAPKFPSQRNKTSLSLQSTAPQGSLGQPKRIQPMVPQPLTMTSRPHPQPQGDIHWSKPPVEEPAVSRSLDVDIAAAAAAEDVHRPESEMDIHLPEDAAPKQPDEQQHQQQEPEQSVRPQSDWQTDGLAIESPFKAKTPNPFKGSHVENDLEENELEALRKTFKRLDTDMDGHVMFNQFKSELPKNLTHSQERFIKQVYDLTSASTFFGLNEFFSLSLLCKKVAFSSGPASEAFQKIDFAHLGQAILQYVELFQAVDRQDTGQISVEALKELLTSTLSSELIEEQFTEMQTVISPEGASSINRTDYLALVPYFLTVKLNVKDIIEEEDQPS